MSRGDRIGDLLGVLRHPLRRRILEVLSEKPHTYTQLMKTLRVEDSSLLSYHLGKMERLVVKDGRLYRLSSEGELVLRVLEGYYGAALFGDNEVLQRFIVSLFLLTVLVPLAMFYWRLLEFSSLITAYCLGALFSLSMLYLFRERARGLELAVFSATYSIWITVRLIVKFLLGL